MQERRKLPRGRTLKAGIISFNRAGVIDCRVRNMSPPAPASSTLSDTRLGAPKATVDRDQAAATALFRHAPTWPSNSLIDNQFLVFRSAANACVIAATAAVFLRKFMLFLRF